MSARVTVTEDLRRSVAGFAAKQGLDIEVVSSGDAVVHIDKAHGKEESSPSVLLAGGWITCPTALHIASRLDMPERKFGMLLAFLEIKVKKCSLGLFG